MSLQSAKGLFFLSISFFYSGILICRVYRQDYNLITKKNIIHVAVLSILIMPILISSFLARGLQDASFDQIVDKLYLYLVSYSSGHLYAFSDWFSQRYFDFSLLDYDQKTLTGGFYTFMSFFRLFGDTREVPMGVYEEYFAIGDILKSNIYTMYRGLISDFTLVGSLFFAVLIGYISSLSFYRFLCSNFNPFWIGCFFMFMGLSYQSYIISSLIWLSLPFVFLLIVFLLFCIKYTANLGGDK